MFSFGKVLLFLLFSCFWLNTFRLISLLFSCFLANLVSTLRILQDDIVLAKFTLFFNFFSFLFVFSCILSAHCIAFLWFLTYHFPYSQSDLLNAVRGYALFFAGFLWQQRASHSLQWQEIFFIRVYSKLISIILSRVHLHWTIFIVSIVRFHYFCFFIIRCSSTVETAEQLIQYWVYRRERVIEEEMTKDYVRKVNSKYRCLTGVEGFWWKDL